MKAQHPRGRSRNLLAKFATAATLLAVACLAGCGASNPLPDVSANVRVVNLAPESGTLSLKVTGESTDFQSNIAYKATTGFKAIKPGAPTFTPTFSTGGANAPTSLAITAIAQQKQLMVVYGGASSVAAATVANDIPVSASGKTKLRIINLAGLGGYDVYITTASENYLTALAKGTVGAGFSGPVELDANTYTIRLTSPAPALRDVLFAMPPRALESQKNYNLVLFSEGSGLLPSAFWLKQDDDGAPEFLANPISRVRAFNGLVLTAGTVNVLLGANAPVNVATSSFSDYARTNSGANTVNYSPASSPTTTYNLNDTFDGARDYSTFLAYEPSSNVPSVFRVVDKNFPPASAKVRIRLVNASTVDNLKAQFTIPASADPITSPMVALRTASDYFEVTANTNITINITGAGGSVGIAQSTTDLLVAGRTFSLVVSGTAGALQTSLKQDSN